MLLVFAISGCGGGGGDGATITPQLFTLTVQKSGTGSGTVTSTPTGIACGATCSGLFPSGTSVTLTATADAGSVFTGWSGSGCTGTGTCVVTMDAAKSVTATFNSDFAQLFALTVNKSGAGSGTVTSTPTGIACGATCSASFQSGTSVTLTATAAAGSAFTSWSGEGCTGTDTCVVIMNGAKSVTGTFATSSSTPPRHWGTATLIETNNLGTAVNPQVAVGPAGNAIAVWAQFKEGVHGLTDIWANWYSGGSWGKPTLVETNDDRFEHAVDPQVAIDPSGNAIVVWIQRDRDPSQGYDSVWANRFVPGVGWEGAVLIEEIGWYARQPQIAVDPSGNAIAVWMHTEGGSSHSIRASRFTPGIGWGGATLVETMAGDARDPQVAIDPMGNTTIVWQHHDGVRYNLWAGGGGGQLLETNDGGVGPPHVAVDPSGNVIVVWPQHDPTTGFTSIWARQFNAGGGWGAVTRIAESNINARDAEHPHVAFDNAGNAIAVWSQLANENRADIWSNRFVPGIGWGVPVLVETTNLGGGFHPQVAFDNSGNAIAVWDQVDVPIYSRDIWSNRFVPGVGWGTAEKIETVVGIGTGIPQLAVDPAGNAIAVWHQHDPTTVERRDIWANRFQ